MTLDFATLKQRQRQEREGYPTNLGLRVHRALSWLNRAEQCDDPDGEFIFLWIAFNAAYANEIVDGERAPEQQAFARFLGKLVDLDTDDILYQLIWTEFSGPIRLLLDNQYVFEPFWDYQRGAWQKDFGVRIEVAVHAGSGALHGTNDHEVDLVLGAVSRIWQAH